MKNTKNKKSEAYCEIKSAWLITWEFHSPNADEELRRLGITNRIIDIVDSHKDYDYIIDYTKNIYRLLMASYGEKLSLIKRSKDSITQDDFFYSHPVLTSYQSEVYKKMMNPNADIYSKEHEALLAQWENFTVSVGHNPSILGRKVNNLKVFHEGLSEWL